jgi:hypothetical protein
LIRRALTLTSIDFYFRLVLADEERKLGRKPGASALLSMEEKRRRLSQRIARFNKLSSKFLDSYINNDESTSDTDDSVESDNAESADEDDDSENPFISRQRRSHSQDNSPIYTKLCLPSNLHRSAVETSSDKLLFAELKLRESQAANALYQIRISLGHKAFLFRKNLRLATGTKQKTRAWQEVYSVEAQVKHQARVYRLARRIMVRLGASKELLATYQELQSDELNATTALLDPKQPGQRNKALAWFWSMDVDRDMAGNGWMEECEPTI